MDLREITVSSAWMPTSIIMSPRLIISYWRRSRGKDWLQKTTITCPTYFLHSEINQAKTYSIRNTGSTENCSTERWIIKKAEMTWREEVLAQDLRKKIDICQRSRVKDNKHQEIQQERLYLRGDQQCRGNTTEWDLSPQLRPRVKRIKGRVLATLASTIMIWLKIQVSSQKSMRSYWEGSHQSRRNGTQ